MKVATIILSLFFVYDVFFVFLSEYIFKANVMETVARGAVDSGSSLPPLPMLILIPKVLFEGSESMLGVGDIVSAC